MPCLYYPASRKMGSRHHIGKRRIFVGRRDCRSASVLRLRGRSAFFAYPLTVLRGVICLIIFLYHIVCGIGVNPRADDRGDLAADIVNLSELRVDDVLSLRGGNFRNSTMGAMLRLYILYDFRFHSGVVTHADAGSQPVGVIHLAVLLRPPHLARNPARRPRLSLRTPLRRKLARLIRA